MNKKLNLCEILKGCEGIELYSTTHGKVKLTKIYGQAHEYPIEYRTIEGKLNYGSVTKEGRFYNYTNGECVLFPSKDQRDWSKFEKSIPIDTPMIVCNHCRNDWKLRYYKGKHNGMHEVFYKGFKSDAKTCGEIYYYVIPFDKFNPNDIRESLKYNIQKTE